MNWIFIVFLFGVSFFSTGGSKAHDLFPIGISKDGKIFEDVSEKPFLVQGDTAWSLIAELSREDVEFYLQDRKKRGFNAILVNLIEHQFSSRPPENFYGETPFKNVAFSELNPNYFDHAEWIIKRAEAMSIAVFLAPAYLGVNGSSQGWFKEAEAAGPDKMRNYGEAVTRRFSAYHNIIWVLGGDFDAPDRRLITSLADGIREVDPKSIFTVHSGRDTNTIELWGDQAWLNFDSIYTYDDVHAVVIDRTRDANMPVILLETAYEFERDTSARLIRRNAYGALLAGAAGQFFGNNPIWHFTGPGVFGADRTWKEALNSPGAKSMTILHGLFDRLPWEQLRPDGDKNIVLDIGSYAASLSDMSLIIIYGDADAFHLNADLLDKKLSALWFDPISGDFVAAKAPSFDGKRLSFVPPHDGIATLDRDWVLLLADDQRLRTIQKK